MVGNPTDAMFFPPIFLLIAILYPFRRMDSDGQGPSRNAGKPDWFLHWLKEVFLPASRDPIKS